jgi:osmotically-inducible protein OsmY
MTTRPARTWSIVALSVLAIVGAAVHATAQTDRVTAALEPLVDDLAVEVASDGVVTVGGSVPSVWAKDRAIRRAIDVDGVDSIVSELTIMRAESDAALADAVAGRIRGYVHYSIFDNVDVHVKDGFVTLVGQVREGVGQRDLTEMVAQVHGTQGVADRIEALPAGDDRVRARVARLIYRHPQFQKYLFRRHPPIRIIVHQADVTLVGEVGSKLEKVLASHLALGAFGVLNVRNQLRIETASGD